MAQLASEPVTAPTGADGLPGASGGTVGRLLRFALATLRRSPERTLFAVAGIGLAIAAVVVVRTIAAGYQDSGTRAVSAATRGAPYWIVPPGGVRLDATSGSLTAAGPLPSVRAPAGWTKTVTRVGSSGWITLTPPPGVTGTPAQVQNATGLRVVEDPAIRPAPGARGLVYATSGTASRAGFLTFDQKFAALLGAQVGSSDLGLVGYVALALGFVIAVTCFAAAVQERRREFGIMASIGLSDEVLYFFLTESVIVFVAAYVVGVGAGAIIVAAAVPEFFTVGAWLQAAALVAMYLPALAIVAALIPAHRLLQQRPVRLLVDVP
jgi:ABC-type antimicrobial peptide transport system permease subunit